MIDGDLYRRAVTAMAAHGLPETMVARMKPWAIAVTLMTPPAQGGVVLDQLLYRQAVSAGKPVQGLETVAEQVDLFDGLSEQEQIGLLRDTVDHLPEITQMLVHQIFDTENDPQRTTLRLLMKGTNFQIKVWEALLRIPMGTVCSYSDIASYIERPKAVRAVGSAVGANALAYLIPCHRVIRQSGMISDYRWGSTRKKAILGWEAARHERQYAGLM